jgi:hypothetical protein
MGERRSPRRLKIDDFLLNEDIEPQMRMDRIFYWECGTATDDAGLRIFFPARTRLAICRLHSRVSFMKGGWI